MIPQGFIQDLLARVDIADVMNGVHAASYFNVKGADGKQHRASITSFLQAGCGYGGSCLPKDVTALVGQAGSLDLEMPLLSSVMRINKTQPEQLLALIRGHYPSLKGLPVAILGLAFKPDVPDLRNSRTVDLVRRFQWLGHEVAIHDPLADPKAAQDEYGLAMSRDVPDERFDVVVCAVAHQDYRGWTAARIAGLTGPCGLVADLPGIWRDRALPVELDRWVP